MSLAASLGERTTGRETPALVLEQVAKMYSSTDGVRGVSLNVDRGEFITLLGPSGSGKTTTLMMIAGLVEPDEGKVWVDGKDITRLSTNKRGLGLTFQNYALFPHMSVWDNLAFPLKVQKELSRSEIKTRVRETLDLIGLGTAAGRRPNQLSGGQQQRVALGRALIYRPPLLLMDEPLGALDRRLREDMQAEIKRIQRELSATILYVTHDRDEAMSMSDRVCVMRDGRMVQVDAPDAIYDRPHNAFVADFLGDANILAGVVADTDGSRCAVTLDAGSTTHVVSDHDVAVGADVAIMVRPEKTRLLGPDADGCMATGQVDGVSFHGSCHRIRATCTRTGARLQVETQPSSKQQLPEIGDVIAVGWEPDAAVLLADRD